MTTYFRPTALASATTPARSGPEGSSWDMTGLDRALQQPHGLLRELLPLLDPLRRSERSRSRMVVLGLLAVDLRPLGLVAGGEERSGASLGHAHSLPRPHVPPYDQGDAFTGRDPPTDPRRPQGGRRGSVGGSRPVKASP